VNERTSEADSNLITQQLHDLVIGDMSSVVLVDDGVLVVGVVNVAHLVQQGAHCQQAELNRH